jgi:hypothetical protein
MTNRLALILLLVFSCTLTVPAQQGAQPAGPQGPPPGPDPNQPQAESILTHLPADTMGFLVMPNIKDMLAHVERTVTDIGLGEELQQNAPGGLLPMIAMMAGLGEGYNPNGGVAVVVLDFKKAGVDVDSLLEGKTAPDFKPPIVIYIAGKELTSIFPAAQKMEDGTMVVPPMGPVHTARAGSYLMIAPSQKALQLAQAGPRAPTAMPPAQIKALGQADIAAYYNMKKVAPLIEKLLAKSKQDAMPPAATQPAEAGAPRPMMGPDMMLGFGMFEMAADLLDQMSHVTAAYRLDKAGLLVDYLVDYVPGSDLGKMVAAYKPSPKPLMNRIPDLPYVLAGGWEWAGADMYVDHSMKMLEQMLGLAELKIPADLRQRMVKLNEALGEEVTAMQMVGGMPKEAGLFGLGFVLECKDAAKVKALLPQKAANLTELAQATIAKKDAEFESLQVKYVKNAGAVAGLPVDAMELTHKELAELSPKERADMVKVLAENKIRFYVVQTDDKTLVVTMGGSMPFLTRCVQAAQAGGKIPADPGVVAAMKHLPKQRVAVFVMSPKNFFDAIQRGMTKMGEPSDLPADFAFKGTTPLAGASTVKGTTVHSVVFVPVTAAKDVYAWIMAEMQASMQKMQQPQPQPGGSDF